EKFKGQKPVLQYEDRVAVVSALRYVSRVIENVGDAQSELIELMKPNWLAIGVDWARKDYYAQLSITPQWLRERQISLASLSHDRSDTISTTRLEERVRDAAK